MNRLKRFFKFSWYGIPIGIIASIFIGAAVLAATLITVTQHIGQEIVDKPIPPPDYGSITALSFDLAKVEVGETVSNTVTDAVIVELKAEGADKFLHLDLTPDILYTAYSVELKCTAIPGAGDEFGMELGTVITVTDLAPNASRRLNGAGTYTFDQTITATAGLTSGDADTQVVVSLQDVE